MKQRYDEITYNDYKNQYLEVYKESEDLYKENIHIYYDYNFTFGMYYYKRYNLYYLCVRNSKLLDIYINLFKERKTINKDQIEKNLDNEYIELVRKVNLIKNQYDQAIVFKNIPEMLVDDLKELIDKFIDITNYIHPDLVNHDDITKKLWKDAVNAYRHNDLEGLRNCRKEIDDLGIELPNKLNLKIDYEKKIKSFKESIEILTSKNIYLKNSFPYNQKELLKSKELINKKIKEVEEDIRLFEGRLSILKEQLDDFLNTNQKYIC